MKHEAPPFKMLVENGRLVPAAAWDQERLATYRNHSAVSVRITQEKNRKLERKYWAILGKVCATCGLKQRTAEDLHKAIRLKLGIVDAFFTMGGKLRVELKSTTGMEEPEYNAFFEEAMDLLFKETGVDPLTLHLESADVGEDEPVPSESPPSDEGRDVDDPPKGVAVENSEGDSTSAIMPDAPSDGGSADLADRSTAANLSSGEEKAGEVVHVGLSDASPAEHECIKKMLGLATDKALSKEEFEEEIDIAADRWTGALPDARRAFVQSAWATSKKVHKGELKPDVAKRYLEGLAA